MAESITRTTDVGNYDLLRTPSGPENRPSPSHITKWIVVAVFVIVAAIATYVAVTKRRSAVQVATLPPAKVTPRGADRSLGGDPANITVPPLDLTDPLVRELLRQLSSQASVAAWLMSDGLIRNFAVVVSNVAEGPTPAVHLRPLRPTTGFKVADRNGHLLIDTRSYERYDRFAAAAASIDPAGAARLYATLKPRIEEAHRDLGTGLSFDRTLELAIVALLKTPVVADPIAVRPEGGTGYAYIDPALEALTPAQKHLLRTGSANVQAIQIWLRSVALALGIPAERLPAPRG
jgi:Protein of unknown function (DUF3014)